MATKQPVKQWDEQVGRLVNAAYGFEIVLDHNEGEAWFHEFNDRSCYPEALRDLAEMFNRAADILEEED